MAYKEGIAEFLDRVSKISSRKEQVATLRKDHNRTLENIIDLCFNPNIKWLLPVGKPPYKPQPKEQDLQGNLYNQTRRFGVFLASGPYPQMNPTQREAQFIQFLESLDPDDAKLVCDVKDKKMPYKGITQKLFEEAWPALASSWVERKNG
jgi:hypothetical protein